MKSIHCTTLSVDFTKYSPILFSFCLRPCQQSTFPLLDYTMSKFHEIFQKIKNATINCYQNKFLILLVGPILIDINHKSRTLNLTRSPQQMHTQYLLSKLFTGERLTRFLRFQSSIMKYGYNLKKKIKKKLHFIKV